MAAQHISAPTTRNILRIPSVSNVLGYRRCSGPIARLSLEQCYSLFYADEFTSLEELRQSYEVTVKRASNNVERVNQLNKAYYRILQHRYQQEMYKDGSMPKGSFLQYEGVSKDGPGTNARHGQGTGGNNAQPESYRRAHLKHGGSIDKMVDSLVTRSMDKVDTSELEGFGKPLPEHPENPFIDNMQMKLNQILMRNDFTTNWIELQKEIRKRLEMARLLLTHEQKRLGGDGPSKLSASEESEWRKAVMAFRTEVQNINKLVDDHNIAVPVISMQMMRYDAERELEKLREQWQTNCNEQERSERETVTLPPSDKASKTDTGTLWQEVKKFFGF